MVMLPFQGAVDQICDGTKVMTTREDAKLFYYTMFHKSIPYPPNLDLWFKRPYVEEAFVIGKIPWGGLIRCYGSKFNEMMARWDGFDSVEDYKNRLADIKGLGPTPGGRIRFDDRTRMQVINNTEWTCILWGKDWLDGPHPRKVA